MRIKLTYMLACVAAVATAAAPTAAADPLPAQPAVVPLRRRPWPDILARPASVAGGHHGGWGDHGGWDSDPAGGGDWGVGSF